MCKLFNFRWACRTWNKEATSWVRWWIGYIDFIRLIKTKKWSNNGMLRNNWGINTFNLRFQIYNSDQFWGLLKYERQGLQAWMWAKKKLTFWVKGSSISSNSITKREPAIPGTPKIVILAYRRGKHTYCTLHKTKIAVWSILDGGVLHEVVISVWEGVEFV